MQKTLEVLRQPLEDKVVTIPPPRGRSTSWPTSCSLERSTPVCTATGATRPLTRECTFTPATVTRYQKRISGPLLDHVDVPRVAYEKGPSLYSSAW